MAVNSESLKLLKQMIIRWYLQRSKRKRNVSLLSRKTTVKLPNWIQERRRKCFVEAILAVLCRPRNQLLWKHPRSFVWIEMVDEQTYDDELLPTLE